MTTHEVAVEAAQPSEHLLREIKSARVMAMHELLCHLALSMDCRFLLQGELIEPIEVFSPSALLPVLAWTAQDAGQRLLGADFGCVLKKAGPGEIALTGARCVVPHVTGHLADITRAMFFVHSATVLFGMRPGAFLEVEPLYMSFAKLFDHHFEAQAQTGEKGVYSWPQMSPIQ